jgi:hypothetical protein
MLDEGDIFKNIHFFAFANAILLQRSKIISYAVSTFVSNEWNIVSGREKCI